MDKLTEDYVANAKRSGRLCFVHSDDVYDVTDFATRHPGGVDNLTKHAGDDITDVMSAVSGPHNHSDAAYAILKKYRIGKLIKHSSEQDDPIQDDPVKDDPIDWSKPVLHQIPSLGSGYFDWVHRPIDRPIRMLTSDLLEFFTTCYWWMVPLYWVPVMCGFLYLSYNNMKLWSDFGAFGLPISIMPVLFIFGAILWTFLEYCVHRWLFHLCPPANSPVLIKLHFMLHGQHHKSPMDHLRLVFPPLPASLFGVVIYAGYAFLLPHAIAQCIFAGTVCGYIFYDLTHYYIHHGTPWMTYFQRLKRYHVLHHYVEQQLGFGISTTFWDYPFGTLIPMKEE